MPPQARGGAARPAARSAEETRHVAKDVVAAYACTLGALAVLVALALTQLSFDVDTSPDSFVDPSAPESVHLRTLRDVVAFAKEMDALRAGPGPAHGPAVRERQQSKPSYWLGIIYESRAGNMLADSDFACVAELEDALPHALPHFDRFCHKEPVATKLSPIQLLAPYLATVAQTSLNISGDAADAVAAALADPSQALPKTAPPSCAEWYLASNASPPCELECAPPVSLATALRLVRNATRTAADALPESALLDALKYAAGPRGGDVVARFPADLLDRSFGLPHALRWFFDRHYISSDVATCNGDHAAAPPPFVCPARVARKLRTAFVFSLPLQNHSAYTDRRTEQDSLYAAFVRHATAAIPRLVRGLRSCDGVRVLHWGAFVTQDEIRDVILRDVRLFVASIVIVTAMLFLFLRRSFVATMHALVAVLGALPLAIAACGIALGMAYLPFLVVAAPFVLLGIGCDDVLLVADAHVRDGMRGVSRARRAALATSFTTAVAFMACFVYSAVIPVRVLGLVSAVGVVCCFAITFGLMPFALGSGNRAKAPSACPATWRCWINRAARTDGDELELARLGSDGGGGEAAAEAEAGAGAGAGVPSKDGTWSVLDRMHIALADVVVRRYPARFATSTVVALVAFGAYAGAALRPADAPPMLLDRRNDLMELQTVLKSNFESESWTELDLVWGVEASASSHDKWHVSTSSDVSYALNPYAPRGTPAFDPAFRFTERTARNIARACEEARAQRQSLLLTPGADERRCATEVFLEWLGDGGVDDASLASWLANSTAGGGAGLGDAFPRDVDNTVRAVVEAFYVDLHPLSAKLSDVRRVLGAWDAFVQGRDDAVVHASTLWSRVTMSDSIREGAAHVPAAAAAASVVSTAPLVRRLRRWEALRAVLAILVSLALALAVSLSALATAGWRFGPIESLCATLLAGSSVDYCTHVVAAFGESAEAAAACGNDALGDGDGGAEEEAGDVEGVPLLLNGGGGGEVAASDDATERAARALRHAGPVALRAATTTAAACAPLLFAEVTALKRIGEAVCLNTLVGYGVAVVCLPSLLAARAPSPV